MDIESLMIYLENIINKRIKLLEEYEMIKVIKENNIEYYETLLLGNIMCVNYLLFDTVKEFKKMSESDSIRSMLLLLSASSEYNEIHIKREEKKILNEIRNIKGRFIDKEKVKNDIDKRFILFEAGIGNIKLEDWSLTMEMEEILSIGNRILNGLIKYLMNIESISVIFAILIERSIKQRMWEDSGEILRQLNGVGYVVCKRLLERGIKSFNDLKRLSVIEIDEIVGRRVGESIKQDLNKICNYKMEIVKIEKIKELNENRIKISLSIESEINEIGKYPFHLFVYYKSGNKILYHRLIYHNEKLEIKIEENNNKKESDLIIFLINSNYIGLDIKNEISLRHLSSNEIKSEVIKPLIQSKMEISNEIEENKAIENNNNNIGLLDESYELNINSILNEIFKDNNNEKIENNVKKNKTKENNKRKYNCNNNEKEKSKRMKSIELNNINPIICNSINEESSKINIDAIKPNLDVSKFFEDIFTPF